MCPTCERLPAADRRDHGGIGPAAIPDAPRPRHAETVK